MHSQAVTLFNSSLIGVSAGQDFPWPGGRSALVVQGSVFGAGSLTLQFRGPQGTYMSVCSTFLAAQIFPFDAPAGQYRMASAASSAIGITAALVTIPY